MSAGRQIHSKGKKLKGGIVSIMTLPKTKAAKNRLQPEICRRYVLKEETSISEKRDLIGFFLRIRFG